MSQWTSPGRIVTGLVSAAVIAAALVSMSGTQRAQSLGLTQHGALITAQDAGAADAVATVAVAPGTAGQVLTVSDAGLPHWAAASGGGGLTVTTYYASDFVAEVGSESASITGTGSASTVTITASSTTRTYGTAGATAARAVLALPAGASEVWVEIQVTAASGLSTSGSRWIGCALRNAISGGAPTALWGIAAADNNNYSASNLLGGANAGHQLTGLGSSPVAADRWWRVTLRPREALLSQLVATGSAGARPSVWSPPSTAVVLPISSSGTVLIPDTGGNTALVLYLQSFGGGGGSSWTARVTVRVTS